MIYFSHHAEGAEIDIGRSESYDGRMEVNLTAEVEAKLNKLANETGREPNELVEDVVSGYFEELAQVHGMLDRRYDELNSGKVKPLDGEEAFDRLRRKSEDGRSRPS